MNWNIEIFWMIHSWVGIAPWLDQMWIFLADWFDVILIVLSFLFLLGFHDPKPDQPYASWPEVRARLKGLILVSTSGIVAWLIALIIKAIAQAPRPFLVLENVTLLLPYGSYDSFPSGHATLFSALATALYFYNHRVGAWFAFGALVIGIARIAVGIHYPIDVVVGYGLGIVISFGTLLFYRYLKKRFIMDEWLKHLS